MRSAVLRRSGRLHAMTAHRIAYATSEITPFAKTGGLADVSGALPARLRRAGHDVRVFVPLHSTIELPAWDFEPVESLQDISLRFGRFGVHFSVFSALLPGEDVTVYFVHCPRLYDRPTLYTDDPDEPLRFALLSRAVLECCQRLQWAPDVVHCHDWQTALIPLYLKTLYAWDTLFAGTRTLLTIHNLGYQGVFPAEVVGPLGFGESRHLLDAGDLAAGRVNFLKTGLRHADRLSTVSPTYAREIQTEAHGFGLHELLRRRAGDLTGILNGVDEEIWNPRTDELIAARYSARSLWRKEKNKSALLTGMGLAEAKGVPTVGMITRLAGQKGVDLLVDSLPEVLEARDWRLVVLADGEARHEMFLHDLRRGFADRVAFYRGFHGELAHLIEAGADFFLMPSIYEPCGLNQMYSLLYGTVPIVRRTGGLADTVEPFDPETGKGNGIVFEHATPEAVVWALNTALDLYARPKLFKQLRANGITGADFSWDRATRAYEALFDEFVGMSAPETAANEPPPGKVKS